MLDHLTSLDRHDVYIVDPSELISCTELVATHQLRLIGRRVLTKFCPVASDYYQGTTVILKDIDSTHRFGAMEFSNMTFPVRQDEFRVGEDYLDMKQMKITFEVSVKVQQRR